MSNEEKILSMLTKMQADIETLKQPENTQADKNKLTSEIQYTILETMRDMLTDEEKDALGKYMEAEMARKVALYG